MFFVVFTFSARFGFGASFWTLWGRTHLVPRPFETGLLGALGPAKSRSRLVFSGPGSLQERSKRPPRALQEDSKSSRGSKLRPRGLRGPIFTPPGPSGPHKYHLFALNLCDFKELPRGFKNRPSDITHTSQPRFPWSSSGEAFNDSCWTSPNPYRIPHRIFTASFQRSSLTLQNYRCFTESSRWNACTILTHRYRCPRRKLTGTPHDPPRIITF